MARERSRSPAPLERHREGDPDFDFDSVLDRSAFLTEKHDLKGEFGADADAIPMWVADMDFPISPGIHEAIKARAFHPSFGYTIQPEKVWSAVAKWFAEHHSWNIDLSWFVWSPTVILASSFCIRAFSEPGDAVMVLTPLYAPLQGIVTGEGRKIVRHSMKLVECSLGERAQTDCKLAYTIDFDAFEDQLRRENVRLLVFCSPHNPGSKVWSLAELQQVVEICRRHKVMILSDEIHADWCIFGSKHIPMATVAAHDEVVTVGGPGKTFGIPGLQGSFVVLADDAKRKRYLDTMQHTLAHEGNVFATFGMMAAYENGGPWLACAKKYVENNMLEVEQFLKEHVPEVRAWHPQATFLMWLDFSSLKMSADELQAMLVKAGLILSPGKQFGDEAAEYQRLNVACSRKVLREALGRLERAVQARRCSKA